MTSYQNSTILNELSLGKTTQYSDKYNPSLLQAVPRSLNRDSLAITENNLPFKGEDVWYGYELSWLNEKGKPVVAVAEFRFPCTSPNLVESKSFKLYLNGFNQTRFASWQAVEALLINDLSNTAGAKAQVHLYSVNNCPALNISSDKFICIDEEDISVIDYQYKPDLLLSNTNVDNTKAGNTCLDETTTNITEEYIVSHLLKSNCLITNQPDWASVYIHYKGQAINHQLLLKYLISFRQHNEFHEQCVERIFCDISHYCKPEALTIFARYTRRGGLDINPFRSTENNTAPNKRTLRQ